MNIYFCCIIEYGFCNHIACSIVWSVCCMFICHLKYYVLSVARNIFVFITETFLKVCRVRWTVPVSVKNKCEQSYGLFHIGTKGGVSKSCTVHVHQFVVCVLIKKCEYIYIYIYMHTLSYSVLLSNALWHNCTLLFKLMFEAIHLHSVWKKLKCGPHILKICCMYLLYYEP
jgi:hypothetical protein